MMAAVNFGLSFHPVATYNPQPRFHREWGWDLLAGCLGVFIVTISGCAPAGPEETLRRYFEAVDRNDAKAAHALLAEVDRKSHPEAAYARILQQKANDPVDRASAPFLQRGTISLEGAPVGGADLGARVVAMVPVTRPARAYLHERLAAGAFGGGDPARLSGLITDAIKAGNVPTETAVERHTLIREVDGWRVLLDLARLDRVNTLLAQAVAAERAGRFDEALERFAQVQALDPAIPALDRQMDRVRQAKTRAEEKAEIDRKAKAARERLDPLGGSLKLGANPKYDDPFKVPIQLGAQPDSGPSLDVPLVE